MSLEETMNERFKKIRKEKKLTQKAFAEKLNLSQNFIGQIETGLKSPSDRTVQDVCRIYNVNYEWLVYGTGDQYRNNDDHIRAIIDDILDGEDSIAKRAFYEFAKLDPSQWEALEQIMKGIMAGDQKN